MGLKALATSINELSRDYADLAHLLKTTARDVKATKQLWRNRSTPLLVKAGLALIACPEPMVSDMLGAVLLAAGIVQEGIRRQAIHIDDLPMALQSAVNNLKATNALV